MFFFFKQKTAYEVRISDWSSDVCSSDLGTLAGVGREAEAAARERAKEWIGGLDFVSRDEFEAVKEMAAKAREEAEALRARLEALENSAEQKASPKKAESHIAFALWRKQIRRASCRDRVWQDVELSVVAVSCKNTKKKKK